MKTIKDMIPRVHAQLRSPAVRQAGLFCALAGMTAISAAMVKQATHMPALASVATLAPTQLRTVSNTSGRTLTGPLTGPGNPAAQVQSVSHADQTSSQVVEPTRKESQQAIRLITSMGDQIRWFNGRPVRPARVIWMQVTAYSPDSRSCGNFADGKTASLYSVQTNAGHLVAADTKLFPFGTLFSIEGYADDQIVPVLDRGGAIKGHHIDLLMPTHRQARRWGNQRMPVVVWEYADGKPAGDPRAFR